MRSIVRGGLHLLGRHVRELALHDAGARARAVVQRARDAEVGELDVAGLVDEHVGRRDVAVHQAERPAGLVGHGVRVHERVGHLQHHLDGGRVADAGAAMAQHAQHARQRRAVDQLHRQVELAAVLADVEQGDDVRVHQPRRQPRLVEQHARKRRDRRRARRAAA